MNFILNFLQRCFWMTASPSSDLGENGFTQGFPVLFDLLFHLPPSFFDPPILSFFSLAV
jgi:hypothetical protein